VKYSWIAFILMLLPACGKNTPSVAAPSTSPIALTFTLPPPFEPTSAATALPSPGITPGYPPPLAMVSAVSGIPIPGAVVNHLAMDDANLYWTTGGGGHLLSHPLATAENSPATILTGTQFSQGRLSAFPRPSLFRVGDWLIFDDRQFAERSSGWMIRAFNVIHQTEKFLVQNRAGDILYSFSTDGEWLVWITGNASAGTSVSAQNLRTGERTELASSESGQTGWEQVSVSAGRAAAIALGPDGRSLFLFDLATGQNRKLLTETDGSDMNGLTFDGNRMAWKTGTNFQGPTALYNLQTGTTDLLPNWGMQPVLAGRWLTWEPAAEQPLYLLDLEKHRSYLVAEARAGEELTSASIRGKLIAWGRSHLESTDGSQVNSRVEWRGLPE
jgi:hypothetical protein